MYISLERSFLNGRILLRENDKSNEFTKKKDIKICLNMK